MHGRRPLVLLAVLSLLASLAALPASTAAGAAATDPGPTGQLAAQTVSPESSNATWKLGLAPQSIRRIGYTRPGLDIGATLTRSNDHLTDRWADHALSVRLEAASSDEERFDLLVNESDRVAAHIEQLRGEERDAIAAYSTGELGTTGLLTQLARIHARTDHLQSRVDSIRSGGEAIQSASVIARADELEVAVTALRGPVRERAVAVHRGEAPTVQVYAETSDGGVVLSSMMDDAYVREAYHGGRRTAEGPTISLQDAITVFSGIYPTAFTNVDDMQVGGQRSTGIYYVTLTTNNREQLRSFLDNRNRTVFKEFYRQPRPWIKFTPAASVSENGTVVRINRTYPSGPMRVTVLDGETGDPVTATVTIDDVVVGRTNPYGTVWAIENRGPDRLSIARTDGRYVNVTVQPPSNPPGASVAGGESGLGGSDQAVSPTQLAQA